MTIDLANAIARIDESDIEHMGIEDKHGLAMATITEVPGHRDPFDLMLVAQATTDGLTIISSDHKLMHYSVNVMAC